MVRKFEFHPRHKVEVSIDRGDGIYRSWFPATIIRRVSSDKFFVKYVHLKVSPTVVGVHQLRPVPRSVRDWEVNIGDKVEAFQKQRWSEGHVSEVIGSTGRLFSVRFSDSKEMIVSKEKLRVHRKWINHNWVPPITNQKLKNHNKELRRELKKERRANRRNMISKLPDCILLHIMNLLKAQDAVRTCILSKRWKDLCKRLPTLTYIPSCAQSLKNFNSWVLSCRDHSCSLLNLTIQFCIQEDEEDLYKLVQYTLSHNLEHLKVNINPSFKPKSELLPLIFGSHLLTFLDLCYSSNNKNVKCPKSLHLPAVRTLHLKCVNFVATHHQYADPFSNCHVLNTLVLDDCSLSEDAQVLCISNYALSNLTIFCVTPYQFSLSTPNLSHFTISGSSIFHQLLFSTCNFSFLQQVNMHGPIYDGKTSIFLTWLQVFANVKILKVDNYVIQTILRDWRLNPISKKAQPPCFVRLESLKANKSSNSGLRDKEIMEVAKHLLQNTTPMPRVLIS